MFQYKTFHYNSKGLNDSSQLCSSSHACNVLMGIVSVNET